MRIFHLLAWAFFLLLSCGKEERKSVFLPNIRFHTSINLDLPLYKKLTTPLNPVILPQVGLKGVVVVAVGANFYAWEMACPNQPIDQCTALSLEEGLVLVCPCDGLRYHIASGQELTGKSKIPLLMYSVSRTNNILTIAN